MPTQNKTLRRWWDLPAALLLLVALSTAATRLVTTEWTRHLGITQTLVFFGVILGLALGKSSFSPRVAAFMAFAYGLFAVPVQLGLTLNHELTWLERMSILLNRLGIIIYQLIRQEAVQDSLLFLVLMGALFWVLSAYGGYILIRHGNAWLAILPTGVAMFVIHTFDPLITRRAWYLAVYLFLSLVLVARMEFLRRQEGWQQSRTALPPHLGFDFIRFALIATAIIVIFAWTAPALASTLPAAERAWQPVRQVWNDARDHFDNAFASLRATVGVVSDYYGPSALLGRGNPLSDTIVFSVRTTSNVPPSVRYYWRARTYDSYDNGQWLSTGNTTRYFDPDDDELENGRIYGRYPASFEIVSASNMNTLFYPPQPLWINRPGQAEFVTYPDETVDVASFRAAPSISQGQTYKVQASVSHPTIAQMMAAGSEYPEWITERYLQLPESITPRTHQLAQDITEGLVTPYEKVVAVTQYLRENIEYVDTISEEPPRDQEIVDWFLFDLQQGFCNYYATSEVVLLRSLGIPARWSVGFAQGDRYEDDSFPGQTPTYIVRQRDAHAWPEVYFPVIGWVEFEPTASQPMLAHLSGDNLDEASTNLPPDSDDELRRQEMLEEELNALREDRGQGQLGPNQSEQNILSVVYWVIPLVLGGLLLFVGWRMRDRINVGTFPIQLESALVKVGIQPPEAIRQWSRRAALPPLTKAYQEINRALSRLGEKQATDKTPTERAQVLGHVLPTAEIPAQNLVHEYQVETFSTQPANLPVARQAGTEIRTLSLKAWIRRLFAKLQQPKEEHPQLPRTKG